MTAFDILYYKHLKYKTEKSYTNLNAVEKCLCG